MTSRFTRLHPAIQQFIWDEQWQSLRRIQEQTIDAIFNTDAHVLVSAPTASGKTEAAFLPILSKILSSPKEGVQAVYVGPLKALINDQFHRMEELCHHTDTPVYRWHGDASQAEKNKLIAKPTGILLITPESIESLFINRTRHLHSLFRNTRYIVIDEIHAFMGTERGAHLKSLLSRIDLLRERPVRRIGLSATIGSPERTAKWMCPANCVNHTTIQSDTNGRRISIKIHGYERQKLIFNDPNRKENSKVRLEDDRCVAEDIYRNLRGQTNLIFGNAKSELELYTDLLNSLCDSQRQPKEFLIHHGSLHKSVREDVEHRMTYDRHPYSTLCTNTLELGIDVGNIDAVAQIDPPFSVSSLVQRLGRSGRKEGASSILRFFVREDRIDEQSELYDRLYPNLLKSTAMTSLLLRQWCEPLQDGGHYSTLTQQLLSVLKETGGLRADEIHRRLIGAGAFNDVTTAEFLDLLRKLGDDGILRQAPNTKELFLTTSAERITNHYDFYSAFSAKEEFSVHCGPDQIGTVSYLGLEKADVFILAGRRWEVLVIDDNRKQITVKPTLRKQPPSFLSNAYSGTHAKVREEMKYWLFSPHKPIFLDKNAYAMLQTARETAMKAELHLQSLVASGKSTLLFPWTSDRIVNTLRLLANHNDISVSAEASNTTLVFEGRSISDTHRFLESIAENRFDLELAVKNISRQSKVQEKYDSMLTDTLLNRAYTLRVLDEQGTRSWAIRYLSTVH